MLQPKKENSRIKAEYSPDEVNELPLAPVFPKPLKCSRCKYSSKVRTNLMIHLNLHLDSAAQECDVPDAEVVNPVPVSYTHLDVYKRQTYTCQVAYQAKINN